MRLAAQRVLFAPRRIFEGFIEQLHDPCQLVFRRHSMTVKHCRGLRLIDAVRVASLPKNPSR